MKLSIITPYYNSLEETKFLASHLEPQLTDEVEWIIVDDGCKERKLDDIKARVVHLSTNSGNASTPRNMGLIYAKGEYIAFIDSDDDVADNYIEKILEKIDEGFDICYMSWKSNIGSEVIIEDEPPEWNTTVWNRVYKRDLIKDVRFDQLINYGEDSDFNKKVLEANKNKEIKKANIIEPLYSYNRKSDSLTHRYAEGKIKWRNKYNVENHIIEEKCVK